MKRRRRQADFRPPLQATVGVVASAAVVTNTKKPPTIQTTWIVIRTAIWRAIEIASLDTPRPDEQFHQVLDPFGSNRRVLWTVTIGLPRTVMRTVIVVVPTTIGGGTTAAVGIVMTMIATLAAAVADACAQIEGGTDIARVATM